MRKVLIALGLVTLVSTKIFASGIKLNINDVFVETRVAPVIETGTSLVPLRIIGENLGANLEWDNYSKTVTITKDSAEIKLVIGSKKVRVNNVEKDLLAAPRLIQGTTMLPLRFISETLDSEVEWDSISRTVYVRDRVERYKTRIDFNDQTRVFYEGQVRLQNGLPVPDGEGELLMKNGEILAGRFRKGEIVLGKLIYTNDEIYEGQFKNNKPHGQGRYFYDNGNYYEGEFENGEYNGYGKIFYNTGEILEGYFKDDQFIGY